MTASRGGDGLPTIDLRAHDSGPDSAVPSRGFYLALLLVTTTAAALGLVVELGLGLAPVHLPAETLDYAYASDDEPAAWRVEEAWSAGPLRDGDRLLALGDWTAPQSFESEEARGALDRALRAADPVRASLVREPRFVTRPSRRWSFLIWSGMSSDTGRRDVVLDSSTAGLGLAETLRLFDPTRPERCGPELEGCELEGSLGVLPDRLDLAAAEQVLVAFAPGLARLPPGTGIEIGLGPEEVANGRLAVTPPGETPIQLDRTDGGWSSVATGEQEVDLAGVRRPWRASVGAVAPRALLLLVGVVGLLSLRARAPSPATRYFVLLSAALSLAALPLLTRSLEAWLRPFSARLDMEQGYAAVAAAGGTRYLSIPGTEALVSFASILSVLAVIAWATLRLLHTFPAPSPALAERYRVPRWALLLGLAVGVGGAAWLTRGWSGSAEVAWTVRLLIGIGTPVLLGLFATLVQVARLARARIREERTGEEALQGRLALTGLALGTAILVVAAATPTGYSLSVPWTVEVYDTVQMLRSAALPIGVALPFLGFSLAIARRGLWDVDLIVQRTTLVSALTALFVVAWLALEALLESVLAGGLASVPIAGEVAPPVLAAALTAVSRRSIQGWVSRWTGGDRASLSEALERASDATLSDPPPEARAARLVASLADDLGAPCALLVRRGEGAVWRGWRSEPELPVAAVAASALDGCAAHRHQVAATEHGPLLVTAIGSGTAPKMLLMLGMRDGTTFYSAEERRVLSLFAGGLEARIG